MKTHLIECYHHLDLAWVNGKSAIDKADAMLTLSSAL